MIPSSIYPETTLIPVQFNFRNKIYILSYIYMLKWHILKKFLMELLDTDNFRAFDLIIYCDSVDLLLIIKSRIKRSWNSTDIILKN